MLQLNLRTSQSFDEVIEDLGHVVKLQKADRMHTAEGFEVKSFSELRNIYIQVKNKPIKQQVLEYVSILEK